MPIKKYFFLSIQISLTFFLITISISFLELNLPDSESYSNYSPKYKAIYPFLLEILNSLNLNVINFQILILSISIVFLCYVLNKSTNLLITIIFYLFILLNFYYTSFSKTILTESIFFSLINFTAGLFVLNRKKKIYNIIYGILLGLIISVKTIGIIIVIAFLFLNKLRKDNTNLKLIILSSLMIVIIENMIFYSKNTYRNNVFNIILAGKIFYLSGKYNFEVEDYPPKHLNILTKSKNYFTDVHEYLSKIKNFPAKIEISSDYEVVAQFEFHNELSNDEQELYKNLVDDKKAIIFNLIVNNYKEYFKLSLYHYLGQWVAGFKSAYMKENYPPKFTQLKKSSGGIINQNNIIVFYAKYLLLISFIFFQLLTFIVVKDFIKRKKISNSFCFIFISQFYLLFVSLINISTIRYLMPIYPLLVMSFLITINNYFKSR